MKILKLLIQIVWLLFAGVVPYSILLFWGSAYGIEREFGGYGNELLFILLIGYPLLFFFLSRKIFNKKKRIT